ncbi:MAG: response regulator [Nitrobacter vulgaris]|nr:response regulator [Nitrobacter vulgaris]
MRPLTQARLQVRAGAADGRTGLELAALHRPTGILLDIALPELDGWSMMSLLKQNPATRHIPVHVISGTDDNVRGLQLGAVGYLKKPIDKEELDLVFDRLRHFAGDKIRRVLVVDDDASSRKATSVLVRDDKVAIVEAGDGKAALELLRTDQFDCVILDLMLPDISGFDLLDRASEMKIALPPVVVYSGKELSYEENLKLREYTDSIVIKGARSPERLVDEVGLFLHRVQSHLPVEQRQAMRAAPEKESSLTGRTVLVVDDDMRNAFAMSKVLRTKGLTALLAQDGHKALAQLDMNPRIDIVLMDIMMPSMDGYTTIQEIRKQARFEQLPIIALTAKAMPGDRERCLEAGANDYASKPVDVDQLVAAMRALLSSEVVPA